jgi:hypothetical protein
MRQKNMDNINQYTLTELKKLCSSANQRLHDACRSEGFTQYPYILTTRATAQQMRGWILYHFPGEYYNGRIEIGLIAGLRIHRGVQHTADGYFYCDNITQIAGMREF